MSHSAIRIQMEAVFREKCSPIQLPSPDSQYVQSLFSTLWCLTVEQAVDQAFGVASNYSSGLAVDQFPADGLMGMGFQSISAYNATPVFQSLVSQGQTDEPVFSFKLAASGSELYLGGANSALYTGGFTYTPVTTEVSYRLGMFLTVTNVDCSGLLASQHG